MINDSPIGFFDSGVGGLSVYSRFKTVLPNENTIYFGDLKNMPYGNKSESELVGYARNILNFYKSKNVKAVVIACNTSSAIAYNVLKDEYDFKIYPIIQTCAAEIARYGLDSVGVFATAATIKSNAYKNELLKYSANINVTQIACPNWTTWVEMDEVNTERAQIDIKTRMDEMLISNPQKIILGCTHYPYLMDTLKKYAPENTFLDPAVIFVESIKKDLYKNGILNNSQSSGYEKFYVSACPQAFVKNAKLFYKLPKMPDIISNIENFTKV